MSTYAERGFTLIEVVVTIAVMGTIFVSISALFSTLHQVNAEGNTLTIVTELAQQQLEKIRNVPYNGLTIGTSDVSSILTTYSTIGSPKSAAIVVTQVDPNGLKRVDITISYSDHKVAKVIKVSTLVALNGIDK